jgi:RNA polymerase sigma-70 factor (ECF subfamily)
MLNLAEMPATVISVTPIAGAMDFAFDVALVQGHMTSTLGAEISPQTTWMIAVRDDRDRAAFARLFDYYAPRLKAVARRTGATTAEAEDIVQDVMLSVWQKASQFDPQLSDVSGWVYRIARNRQIDLARRKARPEPEDLTVGEGPPPDPQQIIGMAQEADALREAIALLKPEQKRLIEQAYLGEMSHVEIRDDTGLPLGTIKSRIRLGLERLRHELKGLRKT